MKGAIRAAFPSLPWDATGGPQAVQQVAGMGQQLLARSGCIRTVCEIDGR